MICKTCGREAPTAYVDFHQNVGALLLRFHKRIEGHLCKDCINRYFWQMTLITLFFGWWGLISFFVTWFALSNNIIRYLGTLSLEPVPAGTARPQLSRDAVQRIQPYTPEIMVRLQNGENFQLIAHDVALNAQVTPGQVTMYVQALANATQHRSKG